MPGVSSIRFDKLIPLSIVFSLFRLFCHFFYSYNFSSNKYCVLCAEQRYCQSAIAIFTFLFAVTWQFNQFALLLQAMALYAVQILYLVDHQKVLLSHYIVTYFLARSANLPTGLYFYLLPSVISSFLARTA